MNNINSRHGKLARGTQLLRQFSTVVANDLALSKRILTEQRMGQGQTYKCRRES